MVLTGTIILGFRPGYQQFVNVMGDDEATMTLHNNNSCIQKCINNRQLNVI